MGGGPAAHAAGPPHGVRQDHRFLHRRQGRRGRGGPRPDPRPPRRAPGAGRRQAEGGHRAGVRRREGGGDQHGQLVPRDRRQRPVHDAPEPPGALPRRLVHPHRRGRGAPRAVGQLPAGARALPRRPGARSDGHRRPRGQARPGRLLRLDRLRVHAAARHPRGVPVPHQGADGPAAAGHHRREGVLGRLLARRPGHGARPLPGVHRRRDAGGGLHGAQDRGLPPARGHVQEVRADPCRARVRGERGQRRERRPVRDAGGLRRGGPGLGAVQLDAAHRGLGLPERGLHRGAAADQGAQPVRPDGGPRHAPEPGDRQDRAAGARLPVDDRAPRPVQARRLPTP